MIKLLKSLPVQIILGIVFAIITTPFCTSNMIATAYTGSNLIKDLLMLFLPIVTFGYIFYSMLKFAQQAPLVILSTLTLVILSNAFSLNIGMAISQFLLPHLLSIDGLNISAAQNQIESFLSIPAPFFWTPAKGMVMGLISGIALSFVKSQSIENFAYQVRSFATTILQKVFIPLLPLFVMGFVYKFHYEGAMTTLIVEYGQVLLFTVVLLLSYLFMFVLLANRFNVVKSVQYFRDYAGVMLIAFSTMSSLAALPLALTVTKKEIDNEDYANFSLPMTVNMHLIGDSIVFSTTITTLLLLYHMPLPSLASMMMFTYYYLLSRFSVACVPAGSTLITMPLLAMYLNFSNEMLAIFATVCILQDCIITLGNMMGNCILAKLSYQLFGKKFVRA